MIMDATRDGAELVEWALGIWRDTSAPIEHRWQAFQWLSDRGMGKPMAMVDLHVTEPRTVADLGRLTEADLEDIDRRFRIAHNKPLVIEAKSTEVAPVFPSIEHVFVGSSNIAKASLEAITGVLTVTFTSGSTHRYGSYTLAELEAWKKAPSAGSWFASFIRGHKPEVP